MYYCEFWSILRDNNGIGYFNCIDLLFAAALQSFSLSLCFLSFSIAGCILWQ